MEGMPSFNLPYQQPVTSGSCQFFYEPIDARNKKTPASIDKVGYNDTIMKLWLLMEYYDTMILWLFILSQVLMF